MVNSYKVLLKVIFLIGCTIGVAQAAIPPEIEAVLKTTEGFKYERKVGFQTPQDFIKRKAGNCVDFTNQWYDEFLVRGYSEDRLLLDVTDNGDGTSHMSLIVDGRWKLSAGEYGQRVYDLREDYYAPYRRMGAYRATGVYEETLEPHYMVVKTPHSSSEVFKASKLICKKDSAAYKNSVRFVMTPDVSCKKVGE